MSKYKNILLAEDDEDDIELFLEVLGSVSPQATCTVALNGHEALELLLADPNFYDMIFLDLNMPLVGGLEFLRRRKTENTWCDIPVVVLTTSMSEEQESYELGANLYVTKPGSVKAFENLLGTILNYRVGNNDKLLRDIVRLERMQSK